MSIEMLPAHNQPEQEAVKKRKSELTFIDIPQTSEITGRNDIGFATIEMNPDGSFAVGVLNHIKGVRTRVEGGLYTLPETLSQLAQQVDVRKLVAAGIVQDGDRNTETQYETDINLRRTLQKADIVPLDVTSSQSHDNPQDPDHKLLKIGQWVKDRFTPHGTAKVDVDPETGKVSASRIATIEDYREAYAETGHEQFFEESMAKIEAFAKKLDGRKVYRWNTTPQAGGVAGMNHPTVRFIDEWNRLQDIKKKNGEEANHINFEWRVLTPDIDPQIAQKYGIDLQDPEIKRLYGNPEKPDDPINPFLITKKKHNIIQGVNKEGELLTDTDKKVLRAWHETQAERQKDALSDEEAINIVDDQQLAGRDWLGRMKGKKIFRSHIQFRSDLAVDPTTPQHGVVEHFLSELEAGGIDVFLSHRSRDEEMDAFLPKTAEGDVDPRIADKVMYKVATADQVDGLGKRLTPEQRSYYLDLANEYLEADGQEPLDMNVGHWGQFARFDDAKDHPGAVRTQLLLAKKMLESGVELNDIPECLIVGFGAPDDPDGERVRREVNELRNSPDFADVKDKIKVIRLDYAKYDDQTMKALEEICDINLQISFAEGCEDKITQHLQDGRQVIVADRGGMPPQIVDGVSGHLVDAGDYDKMSDHLLHYYLDIYPDSEKRAEASRKAKENVKQEYTTLANIRDILGIAVLVADKSEQIPEIVTTLKDEKGEYPFVKDAIDIEYEEFVAAERAKNFPQKADVYIASPL